jgi:hypothetical protein
MPWPNGDAFCLTASELLLCHSQAFRLEPGAGPSRHFLRHHDLPFTVARKPQRQALHCPIKMVGKLVSVMLGACALLHLESIKFGRRPKFHRTESGTEQTENGIGLK